MHQLYFYESGLGFPVVFIHGFCESSTLWKSLSEELSDEFRVICPDLPGFGQSPLPDADFSLEEIGDQIISWLKEIGIKQCIVIGHSLGGYISLEILRKYPDFVKAIGLFNSSAFEDPEDKKENRNKLIEFIRIHGVRLFLKTFVPSLFYPKTAKEHQKTIDLISDEGKLIKPESVIKYAAAMRDREDSIELLRKYHDRILLIAGEFDQNIPLEKSTEMAALLDKDNSHIIPDSAHMSLFEQSELCYNAIRKFVRKFD
ncbi:MAG: alpha/beta hydrolase, partial [Cyclobacteriaceae bacterium]|nr:alpha/beta hydrolase [Cyclobacteriaceae bacterium]